MSEKKRFLLAISTTNQHFLPIPTPLNSFAIGRPDGKPAAGAEALNTFRGTNTALAAFIELAEEVKAEISCPLPALLRRVDR